MRKFKQIVAAFLAITVLGMFLIPCADACDNKSHEVEFSIQTAQDHHQEHQNECSPFCSCSCCSVQITFTSSPALKFASQSVVQIFSFYNQPFVYSIFSSIWQPPKIS